MTGSLIEILTNSNKELSNVLLGLKDLFDMFIKYPSASYPYIENGRLDYLVGNAKSFLFEDISELKSFLEDNFDRNYIFPYEINYNHQGKIEFRVTLIDISYNLTMIDQSERIRKTRVSKINKVLKS